MKHKLAGRKYNDHEPFTSRMDRRVAKQADPELLDDMPRRESLRQPHWKYEWRRFGLDNPSPLRRFLNRRVGRTWNEVFAEVCEAFPAGSPLRKKVLSEIEWMVVTRVRIIDGVPCYGAGWGTDIDSPLRGLQDGFRELYVDPRDGILKRTEPRRQQKRSKDNPDVREFPGDDRVQYRRIDGVWYEIRVRPLREDEIVKAMNDGTILYWTDRHSRVRDILMDADRPTLRQIEKFYGRLVVATAKRQLNSREIRKLGL